MKLYAAFFVAFIAISAISAAPASTKTDTAAVVNCIRRDVGRIGDGQEHLRDYFNSLEDIIVETEENIERCYDESDEDVDVNTCVNNVLQETRTAAKQVLYEMAQIDPQIAARVGLAIASCVSGFGFNLY